MKRPYNSFWAKYLQLAVMVFALDHAYAQPTGGDVFSSDSGSGKTWWDVKRRDYPNCTSLVNQHEAMTKQLNQLDAEAKRSVEPQRRQIVQQINDLSRQRTQVQRQIFACIRESSKNHPEQSPLLQGKVEKDDPSSDDRGNKEDKPSGDGKIKPPVEKQLPPHVIVDDPAPPETNLPPTQGGPTSEPPSRPSQPPGDKNKTLSGGTQKGNKPDGGHDNETPPKGNILKGETGKEDSKRNSPPPGKSTLTGEVQKICNLRELAALVDERYKTGNPIALYKVTNRGPNTYLILLAGTELMEMFQANNTIEAVKAYVEGIIPNSDSPYMREILQVLNALPAESKLIIAGHSQGGMQGLNSLNFFNRNTHTSGFFVDQVITFGSPISQISQLNPNSIVTGQNVPQFTFVEVNGDPIPQASLISHQALTIKGADFASWISNHLHYKNSVELEQFDVFGIRGGKACLYLDVESFKSYAAQAFPFQTPQKSAEPTRGPPCNPKPTVQPTVLFQYDWYTATWGSDRTAKDFVRFQPSGDGVTVTDIFRDRQPKGCAGVMLADSFRGAGIKKPKWIRIADIIKEQPTLGQLSGGVPVPETVLGRVAVQAARELGATVVSSSHGVYKKYDFDEGKPWIEVKLSYP